MCIVKYIAQYLYPNFEGAINETTVIHCIDKFIQMATSGIL